MNDAGWDSVRKCHSLYHHDAGHVWFIRDSRSLGRVQQKKHIRVFRLAFRMAGGGRILFCFSGIIATKSDMAYRFLCNFAVGLLSPTEQRIIARSKTGGSAKL